MNITQNAIDAMKQIVHNASSNSPRAGARVLVARGKHKGKIGIVKWHGINKYSSAGRYGSDLSNIVREAVGIHGYCVRIIPDDGSPEFFTNCENLAVKKDGSIEIPG